MNLSILRPTNSRHQNAGDIAHINTVSVDLTEDDGVEPTQAEEACLVLGRLIAAFDLVLVEICPCPSEVRLNIGRRLVRDLH